MAEVERLLTASTVEVRECDPRHRDARFCLQTYFDELAARFQGGYDPAVSPVDDAEMSPPAGLLLVASLHGEPVGCGALIFHPDAVGMVKRMWVAPSDPRAWAGPSPAVRARGPGPHAGLRLMRLETRDELSQAIRMYDDIRLSRGRPVQR